MAIMYFNVKQGIQTGNVVIDAASGNISNIGNITLVGGTSANLGNAAIANYFVGNGVYLTSITGANVTGYVPNATAANTAVSATTAGTVTTAAQPNITSLGTLSGVTLTTNGNVSMNGPASQISGGNLVSANYVSGNGSLLTSITGANVTGYVPNATDANTAGTVTTAAQPNITSLGSLTGLTSTGAINFLGTSNVSLGDISNLHIDGGLSGYVLQTDGAGTLTFVSAGSTGIAGNNTEVQFNDEGSFGASGAFTFDKGTNTLSVTNYVGNGAGFTFITGSNVSGNVNSAIQSNYANTANSVAGANVTGQVGNALIAGTVYTAAQPNITSVGTLSSLSVSGLITATSTGIKTSNIQDSTGTITITTGYGNIAGDVGVYGNLTAGTSGTGNVIASYFIGNGSLLTGLTGANVSGQVGNALIAGTVYTAAQPNITSVGTLLGLSLTGNLDITGNINATGNLNYDNVTDLVVGDPLIYLGANNTGNLYDLGFVASYNDGTYEHTGLARDATDGTWKLFDGVVAEPTTVIDFANGTYAPFKSGAFESTGNITAINANLGNLATASYFSGNGYYLTGIQASGGSANTAGTVTTAAQPNITSVGTLTSLSVTGNVSAGNANVIGTLTVGSLTGANLISANYFAGDGSSLTSITGANVTGNVTSAVQAHYANIANSVAGANVTGQVGNALIAGTVYTAAQPNITSVGTLTSLSVTGNVSAGNIKSDNLLYANGTPYDFVANAAGSNTQVQFNDNDAFAGSAAFTFNKGSNILTVTNFAGNGALLTNITGANVTGYVPLATAANTAGTVTTAAQPNITSVGTLSSLTVSGNLITGNANVTGTLTAGSIETSGAGTGNISGADYIIANYFSGNGSLLTSITGSNVTGNVTSALQSHYANIANSVAGANVSGQVGNALIAGTVYTAAQPNITSVGTLSNLSVTGTVTTGSVKLTNGLTSNRSNVSVTTNTVIDQFTPSTYRTAKYIISASGDHGYQSIETLLVHDDSSSYITIYGSVCSNVSADIVELSSNVNGVSGNVTMYATSASPNAKVNVVVTYINT